MVPCMGVQAVSQPVIGGATHTFGAHGPVIGAAIWVSETGLELEGLAERAIMPGLALRAVREPIGPT